MNDNSGLTAIVLLVLLVFLIGAIAYEATYPEPEPKAPQAITLPLGEGPEATGQHIVDILYTDGSNSDTIAVVVSWLRMHPGYKVETVTPVEYTGGGDTPLRSESFLLVGSK